MQLAVKSRLIVFILAIMVWIALTLGGGLQEIFAGLIVAGLVSLVSGQFLVTTFKQKTLIHRIQYGIAYFFVFLWEMIKANIHVAWIVIQPKRPIKPGIIKIRSTLTKDTALTILANSITLTPGTFTVDINPDNKEMYIHCIDVQSMDMEENSRNIAGRFERYLKEVFE